MHEDRDNSEIRYFPGARHAVISSHARACASAVAKLIQRRGPP